MEDHDLRKTEELERFWRAYILSLPFGEDVGGAAVTYYPDLPYNTCNHAACIDVEEGGMEPHVEEVTRYFGERDFPYAFFRVSPRSNPKALVPLLEDKGFRKGWEESIMVFDGDLTVSQVPKIEIKRITERKLGLWIKIASEVFGVPPEDEEGYHDYILEHMRHGVMCFLAYFEDQPVRTCLLHSLNEIGSIFTVGTLTNYRRRGVGTALTKHAVLGSIEEGNLLHTLQVGRGEYAEKLYEKIGFRTDHRITWYMIKF